MRSPRTAAPLSALVLVILLVVLVARASQPAGADPQSAGAEGGARYRVDAVQAKAAGVPVLPAAVRDATFRFAPGTLDADARLFLAGVAAARPESQRVIALIDGLITVSVAPLGSTLEGGGRLGQMRPLEDGFAIDLDLKAIWGVGAQRAATHATLHEIGHVVDFAIAPDALDAALDAQIPRGTSCEPTGTGAQTNACAPREERFAEAFAKWSSGDLGAGLYAGYKVPPPVPFETWGSPLAALAGP